MQQEITSPEWQKEDRGATTIMPYVVVSRLTEAELKPLDSVEPQVREAMEDLIHRLALNDGAPVYFLAADGTPLYFNKAYIALAGRCNQAARLNLSESDMLPVRLQSVFADVLRAQQDTFLDEVLWLNGKPRRYRSRHFPVFGEAGVLIAVGGSYLEHTRQSEAIDQANLNQNRLNDFVRATSDWFWETDINHQFAMVSDHVTAALGRVSTFLIGKTMADLGELTEDENGRVIAEDAMHAHIPFRNQLFKSEDERGTRRFFYLSGVPVFDTFDGKFTGFRGVGTDVTAKIHAENAAAQARQTLEKTLEELTNKNAELDFASARAAQASEIKDDFLSAMSHELRTPLNAIIGFAEAMSMQVFGEMSDKYISYSEDILVAGRHLLDLINDVLDVGTIDAGELKLDIQPTSLESVIDEARTLVALRAEGKHLDMTSCDIAEDFKISTDPRRLVQIITNLLSNAVKFTHDGGKIGIDVAPAAGRKISVTVWDTGIGIPADKQDLVFQKFQQVQPGGYDGKTEGTGLGLHISRRLAHHMKSDITFESTQGKGSRFTVTLPLADDKSL